jgi:hypothetical protein
LWEQGTPPDGDDDCCVGKAEVFLITTPYTLTVEIIGNYRPKWRRNQGRPLKKDLEV